ncbi:hypothetical protein BGZ76_009328 [Entomortierella beljakovae]|nr:hypothetical protein BGZ76_009328 [Entomortierella beljakovae]
MIDLTKNFSEFDKDGDGRIDASELVALTEALGNPATQEEVDFVLKQFDEDHNGGLDLGEFIKLMKALREAGQDKKQ